jgi:hypothetical protein
MAVYLKMKKFRRNEKINAGWEMTVKKYMGKLASYCQPLLVIMRNAISCEIERNVSASKCLKIHYIVISKRKYLNKSKLIEREATMKY